MIEISTVFDAYINANILLVFGLCLWIGVRALMVRMGLGSAYLTQLQILNGSFLAILACPFVAALYVTALGAGLIPQQFSLSLTDLVVSQYLEGNVAMTPAAFESALSWRDRVSADFLAQQGWMSWSIAALLIIGGIVIAARTLLSILRLRRLIARSYPWRRFGRLDILLSDQIAIPFSTRGLMRRYIVLPSAMLTQSEDMKMALAHEFHHLRHRDIEWEIGLELIKPLFFWNPAFHIWKRNVEHLRELACDQVILARHRLDPKDYGACLLRVCRASVTQDRTQTLLMPQVALVQMERPVLRPSGDVFLKRRIASILDVGASSSKRGSWARWSVLPMAVLIVAVGLSFQKPADWSHDRLMLSTIVNLERMELINGLGVRRP